MKKALLVISVTGLILMSTQFLPRKTPPLEDGWHTVEYSGGHWVYYTRNDKIEGVSKQFYKSGKLRRVATYKNDRYEGKVTDYYENGQIKNEVDYRAGLKNGTEKVYYENG